MEELISVQEAALLRDVSVSTVYRAIREERLTAVTVLGRKALRVEDVRNFNFGSYTKEGEQRKERARLPRGTNSKSIKTKS